MNILSKISARTLRQNKTRTLVTLVGIILSFTMFTAVTTGASSGMDYLADISAEANGMWHIKAYDISGANVQKVLENQDVVSSLIMEDVGYFKTDDTENKSWKPYIFVCGVKGQLNDMFNIKLTSGRMAETKDEIVLPVHYAEEGGKAYQIGDVIDAELGLRFNEDEFPYALDQYYAYSADEHFEAIGRHSYTVVGFYERCEAIEASYCPGYTALTVASENSDTLYKLYLNVSDPEKLADNLNGLFLCINDGDYSYNINTQYLYYSGQVKGYGIITAIYSIMYVLMGIIAIASVSFIYNSFSISLNERVKQLGLLKSIGTTRNQLFKNVIREALTMALIAIPGGIVIGLAGMAVTFAAIDSQISSMLNIATEVALDLEISMFPLIVSAAAGLVTVLISALIPALKVCRLSAMEAIRLSGQVKINPKQVKTSKLTQKLFGIHGVLAAKNYKRSKKKYRSTVFSLSISIVIFVVASSFTYYFESIISGSTYELCNSDIVVTGNGDNGLDQTTEALFKELSALEETKKAAYSATYCTNYASCHSETLIDREYLTDEFIDSSYPVPVEFLNQEVPFGHEVTFHFIDDAAYLEYLKANGLDAEKYMNTEKPVALLCGKYKAYNSKGEYVNINILKNGQAEFYFYKPNSSEAFQDFYYDYDDLKFYSYTIDNETEQAETTPMTDSDFDIYKVTIGGYCSEIPFSLVKESTYEISLLYPYSLLQKIGTENCTSVLTFNKHSGTDLFEKINNIVNEKYGGNYTVFDFAGMQETYRALINIVNVFSYGFIVLISLIAVTNVFNTISTNIMLRRREFAVLSSMGMEHGGLRKMLSFECLLYGTKGMLFGVPISLLLNFLIYMVITGTDSVSVNFAIPWQSLGIAVLSVFLVIGITMLYSMSKLKTDNTVEVIRSEST